MVFEYTLVDDSSFISVAYGFLLESGLFICSAFYGSENTFYECIYSFMRSSA